MDEQMLLRDALSRLLAEKQIECEAVKGEVLVLKQYKESAKKKIGYLKRKIAVLEERLPPSLELSDSSDEAEDDVKIQKNIHPREQSPPLNAQPWSPCDEEGGGDELEMLTPWSPPATLLEPVTSAKKKLKY